MVEEVKMLWELTGDYQIIIGLFPFYNPLTEPFNPARIAPFARANYYREIISRLKDAVVNAPAPLSSLKKSEYRLFCNSRLPEKRLAAEAGLGFIGKNSLLITKERGSAVLIGGVILPSRIELKPVPASQEKTGCGSCHRCEENCPTGAIANREFHREKCIQSWTTDSRKIPDSIKEKWGNRIYGCTICQDVCPWNRNIPQGNMIERGRISNKMTMDFLISADSEEIKDALKGTTMGMSWIKPENLQRNAVLCAVSSGRADLLPQIEALQENTASESLEDACLWALIKLNPGRG